MSARGQRFNSIPSSWSDEVSYRRGQDASAAAIAGGGLFGTGFGADPAAEVKDIDREVQALNDQLIHQLPAAFNVAYASGTATPQMLAEPRADFYVHTWEPWLLKWNKYKADRLSFKSEAVDLLKGPLSLRDDYFAQQKWRAELVDTWNQAKAHGYHLGEIAPKAPDKPIGDRVLGAAGDVGGALKDAGGTLWLVVKVALFGALGLAGVLGLVLIVNEARSGRGVRK